MKKLIKMIQWSNKEITTALFCNMNVPVIMDVWWRQKITRMCQILNTNTRWKPLGTQSSNVKNEISSVLWCNKSIRNFMKKSYWKLQCLVLNTVWYSKIKLQPSVMISIKLHLSVLKERHMQLSEPGIETERKITRKPWRYSLENIHKGTACNMLWTFLGFKEHLKLRFCSEGPKETFPF